MLDMVNFDVITSVDWLSPFYTLLDWFTKIIILVIPGLPSIVWEGSFIYTLMGIISYVWGMIFVSRGYVSYLGYVCDISIEIPSLDSILLFMHLPLLSLLAYIFFLLIMIFSLLLILR